MKMRFKQTTFFEMTQSVILPLKLLSPRDRKLLTAVVLITVFLSFLDLLGVLLIGVVGSLSITGLSANPTGNRVTQVLILFNVENISVEKQVILIGSVAAFAFVLKTLLSLFLLRSTIFFMARRSAVLSYDLVSKYFSLPLSRINQRTIQTSIYALTDGVGKLMIGVIGVLVSIISDTVLLIVMGVGLFIVDSVTAAITAIIFGILSFALYRGMHMKVRKLGVEYGLLSIQSSQRIYEAINAYRELIVRDRRGYYASKIGGIRFRIAQISATTGFMSNLSKYVLEIALVFSAILLAFYQFTTNSAFRAIATITLFVAASTRIIPALLRLQNGFLGIKASLAEANPTIELIKDLSLVNVIQKVSRSFTTNHSDFLPEVKVEQVSFSYDGETRALNNINLRVMDGEFVAVVGGSGTGKTTLIDVILGVLEPQKGKIEISGIPPLEAFATWPGAVSYVPQDSPIIDGTIRENLALGYPDSEISDYECWQSLKISSLDVFVESLPDKLDSKVGDRGTRLSGGQRQRLGIARALITQPRLLLLDEATSALDGITEAEISRAIRELKSRTTVIVIAHRLSTVLEADRIYLMERGTIIDSGTFHELKSRNSDFLKQAELMGL